MRYNDYDRSLHTTYASGRAFAPRMERLWEELLAPHVRRGDRCLDVGCGTGRFLPLLSQLSGRQPVGMDRSLRMLEQAAGPRLRALAESLPFATASRDVALLSMVTHHFRDLDRACRELARVLRPGGRAILRTSFGGSLDDVCYYRYFPAAKTIDDQRLPGAARLDGAFERAGFEVAFRDRVLQIVDDGLAAHRDRLRTRAISTFEFLSEVEIESGFAAMDAAIAADADPGPIRDPIELVVYRRRDDAEHSDPSV